MTKHVIHIIGIAELRDAYPFGGAENHLFELARGQVEVGWKVTLLLLIRQGGPLIDLKIAELESYGIEVCCVPDSAAHRKFGACYFLTTGFLHLTNFLSQNKAAIIHLHLSYAAHVGRLAALFARCKNVIETIHNDEPFFMNLSWRVRLWIFKLITRRYIMISERVRKHYCVSAFLNPKHTKVVYYGVTPRSQFGTKEDLRSQLMLPHDPWIIGFVGRLTPQKNLLLLLDAVKKCGNCELALIGIGFEEEKLRKRAKNLGIEHCVHFLGHRSDAAQYMPAFDIFCLPSLWEGLGLVLLEAMQAKVPIVASDAGAIKEILDSGEYGYIFPSGDLEALVAALSHAKAATHQTEQKALAAYQRIYEFHTVRKMVCETVEVYENLLLESYPITGSSIA